MKVLFYCLGGGHGHLCRSLAVARQLKAQQNAQVRLLVPRRSLEWVDHNMERSAPDRPVAEELGRWFSGEIQSFQPDLLVVDTFPKGVLGEFPDSLELPKILLTPWVNPAFYSLPGMLDALEGYQRIFASEPFSGPVHLVEEGKVLMTEPLVWSSPEESYDRARRELGGAEQPLVLALGSGPLRAQGVLKAKLADFCSHRGWQLRFVSPALGEGVIEVGRWFRGADLVVSASGYQAYYEVAQAGVPAVLLPQRRQHDNQAQRALGQLGLSLRAPHSLARSPGELEHCMERLMENTDRSAVKRYRGALEVADALRRSGVA